MSTVFNTEIFKFAYRYNFLVRDNWEVGGSFGFHWMSIRAGMALQDATVDESFSVNAPLPVFGLHGAWEFAPRLKLRGSTEWFYIDLSDITDNGADINGLLADNLIAVEWDALEFAGFGLGFNFFRLDADVGSNALRLSAKYDYQGILLYGRIFL